MLSLLMTGAVVGVLAGLLGVGGGIVIVPMLFHLFALLGLEESIRMPVAVGTSLATIIPTAFIAARAHHRRGNVDMTLLRQWGPWVLVGVMAGTVFATGNGHGTLLTILFTTVALLVAVQMAFVPEGKAFCSHLPGQAGRRGLAVLIGCLSAMMGMGGGTLSVPILSAFSYPTRQAVGTAAAFGLIIAVPATIGFALSGEGASGQLPLTIGYVNLAALALIVPTTLLTVPLGVRLAHLFQPTVLRKMFAIFLFLTSLRMMYSLYPGFVGIH